MKTMMKCILAGQVGLAALAGGVASADANGQGILQASAVEFQSSCAVCHGETGHGDGNLAAYLTVKPADLTKLTANNHGEFPFLKVFQVIDGRTLVSGHGDRAMPVWGTRYQQDIGETFGPYGGEIAVRARVLDLVYYIQSIQEP